MATLKDFAKKHPGLQHKAGVPLGGTFVIVYKYSDQDPAKNKAFEYLNKWKAMAKGDEENSVGADEEVASVKKSRYIVITKEKGAKKTALEKKVYELEKKGATKAEIEKELGVVLTQGASGAKFEPETDKIPNGTVLADFYLPYPASCGCSPVQFILNIPPPKVALSIKDPEYCNEDTKEYPLTTNPTGGALISSQPDAVKDNGDGTFSFLPNKVKVPSGDKSVAVNFTYTYEDQMQTASVKVYAKPEVKIVAKADSVNPLKIKFDVDKPGLIEKATWDFGDGQNSTDLAPEHTYAKAGEYTITVKVQNGLCSATPDTLNLTVKDPDPVEIKTLPDEICRTAADISFTVKPKGGTFSGDASFSETVPKSGNFVFSPSKVNLNGASKVSLTFNYVAPAGNSGSKTVIVYEKPPAGVHPDNWQTNGTQSAFIFNNLGVTQHIEVDFGDGSVPEKYTVTDPLMFITPVHDFKKAGAYIVKAVLINGTCKTPTEPFSVALQENPDLMEKVCQPLSTPVSKYDKFKEKAYASEEFVELYTKFELDGVSEYFAQLKKQLATDPKVPLSYFAQNPFSVIWIEAIPAEGSAAVRALSLEALSVFSDLATTLSCLKEEDVAAGNFITVHLLNAVVHKLSTFQKLSAPEKKIVKSIVDDVSDEQSKLQKNAELALKPEFMELLRKINKTITTL